MFTLTTTQNSNPNSAISDMCSPLLWLTPFLPRVSMCKFGTGCPIEKSSSLQAWNILRETLQSWVLGWAARDIRLSWENKTWETLKFEAKLNKNILFCCKNQIICTCFEDNIFEDAVKRGQAASCASLCNRSNIDRTGENSNFDRLFYSTMLQWHVIAIDWLMISYVLYTLTPTFETFRFLFWNSHHWWQRTCTAPRRSARPSQGASSHSFSKIIGLRIFVIRNQDQDQFAQST